MVPLPVAVRASLVVIRAIAAAVGTGEMALLHAPIVASPMPMPRREPARRTIGPSAPTRTGAASQTETHLCAAPRTTVHHRAAPCLGRPALRERASALTEGGARATVEAMDATRGTTNWATLGLLGLALLTLGIGNVLTGSLPIGIVLCGLAGGTLLLEAAARAGVGFCRDCPHARARAAAQPRR